MALNALQLHRARVKPHGHDRLREARADLKTKLERVELVTRQIAASISLREKLDRAISRVDTLGGADGTAAAQARTLTAEAESVEASLKELHYDILPRTTAELLATLRGAYEAYRAVLRPRLDHIEARISAGFREWNPSPGRAEHLASTCEFTTYMRSHLRCNFGESQNPTAVARWFLERIDTALAGELPWPKPPPIELYPTPVNGNGHAEPQPIDEHIDEQPRPGKRARRLVSNLP